MPTNYYRAISFVCAIIISVLLWLGGFIINEFMFANPGGVLPVGEWLVPGILIIAALSLVILLFNRMVPRIVSSDSRIGMPVARIAFVLLFVAVFLMGLIFRIR